MKPKITLGEWSKTNKGWRDVLLDGECIGEVTKNSIHCVELEIRSRPIISGSYRKSAEILGELYLRGKGDDYAYILTKRNKKAITFLKQLLNNGLMPLNAVYIGRAADCADGKIREAIKILEGEG